MRITNFSILFIALNLFLFSSGSLAQQKFQKIIEASYETGPLISNGKDWADEVKDLVTYRGADIRIGWRKVSDDFYQQLHRYPTYGVGLSMAVPYYTEIGQPMGVYGFGEFPMSRKGIYKKFNLSYYAQIGLGFGLNPYDSLENPLNQYIGSELNAYIHFGFKANYQLSDQFGLFSTLGLKHYSNGSAKKPNAGINLAPLAIGIRYNLDQNRLPERSEIDYPPLEKRGFWNIAAYLGYKNYEIGAPTYFRGGLGVNYLWQASYKYKIGLGLDMFFAPGYESRNPGEPGTFENQTSLAIVGSWEWNLTDKIYMPIALGTYLHRNTENQELSIYERIGVRYRFDKHLFAGVQIKAHKAKADFFEFTVGYTIPGKVKSIVNQ